MVAVFDNSTDFVIYPFDRMESSTVRKINEFGSLPKGWNFGSGIPSRKDTAKLAKKVLEFGVAEGFVRHDAFPGINGQIILTMYVRNHCLEFDIADDGKISIVWEEGDKDNGDWESLSLAQTKDKILELKGKIWNSLGRYTGVITTKHVEGLSAKHSNRQTTAAYPWSIKIASDSTVELSASISGNTIPSLSTAAQSTGRSRRPTYQTTTR